MDLQIRVKAFDDHGIKLIPPTYTDFDELAGPLIGRVADIGLKLKPMLMIVSNESPQTVVSYSKTWTARYAGGRTSVIRGHTSFPETVCGDILIAKDPEALPPGAKRVETARLVIQAYAQSEPYYDQFLDQFIVEKDQMLKNAEELRIELDTVIFADGRLIGNDQDGWLSDLFSEYIAQKQTWYREILSRLEAGAAVEDAYAPIRAFQEQRNVRMRSGRPLDRADVQLWKTQAAGDAQRWRRNFTDAELPHLLRSSIRLEPFVIRRTLDGGR
jgi:hypothetical protein